MVRRGTPPSVVDVAELAAVAGVNAEAARYATDAAHGSSPRALLLVEKPVEPGRPNRRSTRIPYALRLHDRRSAQRKINEARRCRCEQREN